MKQNILILICAAGIMLTGCEVKIAQNEQDLYGLKQGSKWVAEPEFTQLFLEHFNCGDFYIGKKIPGTQKHYHAIFDSKGKLIMECNAGYFFDKDEKYPDFLCIDPDSTFRFQLDSLKERGRRESETVYLPDLFSKEPKDLISSNNKSTSL
jgi:hypothetical protein